MPLSFTCPHCDYTSLVDDRYVGQSGPCAACGKTVTVVDARKSAASPLAREAARSSPGVGRMMLVSLVSLAAIVLLFGAAVGVIYMAIRSSEVARTGTLQDPCAANLAAIGQAMLQYHNAHGRFPPAVVRDEQGRPMHSWRVLLLPYLGQESLFHQYNMSVPWSDPQNQLLAAQMPAVYHCPTSFNVAGSETSYVVVTSPDGVFGDAESASLLEIHDGPEKTLLVVEATGGAINWLEPRDLLSDTMSQTVNGPSAGGISSQHNGGAHVLMADGTVKFLSNLTSPETLEALLTIDANDTPAEW